jgi:peroxiredoxin
MASIVPPVSGTDDFIKTLEIGANVPDFNLPGIDGKNHGLNEYSSATILVIIFTANHCRTAQAYEGRIIQLVKDYQDRGVAFVAIAPNDPLALTPSELVFSDLNDSLNEMKIRAKERGFNFPYLFDGDTQKVALAFGPVSTPHVFIFDQARKLQYVGRIDNAENIQKVTQTDARNALEALLAGKPIPVQKTRTFGCSIKWSEKRDSVKRELEKMAKEPVTLELAGPEILRNLIKNDTPKLRLINLWETGSDPSLKNLPELVQLNRMYRNSNFEVITVSLDVPKRKEQVLADLRERKVSCSNYILEKMEGDALSAAIGAEWKAAVPFTFLVEPGGKIIQCQSGQIDSMKFKEVIALHPARQ